MMRCREAKEFLTHNPEAPISLRLATGEMIDLTLDVLWGWGPVSGFIALFQF